MLGSWGAPWMALIIGNSRLHWALFEGPQFRGSWHTSHLSQTQAHQLQAEGLGAGAWQQLFPEGVTAPFPKSAWLPLWVASVVEPQLALWQSYKALQVVDQAQIPLQNQYSSLGLDRALSLLGAGLQYGWPVLVIDAGTALTFTAGVDQAFWGGAILPGLSLQAGALVQGTDALPMVDWPPALPKRWASSTLEAIQSGILYTHLAGLQDYCTDWRRKFPAGKIVLAGGDGKKLLSYLRPIAPETAEQIQLDSDVMFLGMAACRTATDC